jgi:hypothetical protein
VQIPIHVLQSGLGSCNTFQTEWNSSRQFKFAFRRFDVLQLYNFGGRACGEFIGAGVSIHGLQLTISSAVKFRGTLDFNPIPVVRLYLLAQVH